MARIDNTVLTLRQIPGQDWVVHQRYSRPDMPDTLQVGLVSYTDWEKASDFDEFFHNSNKLSESGVDPTPGEAFNPDLVAGFEFARYVRPQIPTELEGVDLLNGATDAQLLSFLGESVNLPGVVAPLPVDLPQVSVNVISAYIDEAAGNVAAFSISRAGTETDEALVVNYSVAGTADGGTDYTPLPETAVIPAGASSVTIDVQVTDDALVEGGETINLQLVDAVFYELGDLMAVVTIADDDFMPIGNHTIPGHPGQLTLSLPATYPDGTTLPYTAKVLGSDEFALDQQYSFYVEESYYENWSGHNERWVNANQGGTSWFYLLPDGQLYRWEGSFADSSLIASLDAAVYETPTQLTEPDVVNASVSIDCDEVLIAPQTGFIGEFTVRLTADDGIASATTQFTVAVTNVSPVLATLGNLVIDNAVGTLSVELAASDADGDVLVYGAELINSVIGELDATLDLQATNDFHTNWGGHNEKWLRSNSGHWCFILPNGEFHRWTGNFNDSELLTTLDTTFYDNPNLIAEPQAISVVVSVNGSQLLIDAADDFVGTLQVRVSVSDGCETVTQLINVAVGL